MMARLLGVSRSGYYSWLDAGGHLDPLAGLKDVVAALWEGSGGAFGWRRVKAELPPEWSGASGYSVLKSMRELGLRGFRPRSSKRTTVSDPDAPARPDLVRRRFNPPVPTTVPCGDIAHLRTGEGRPCLASVVDLPARMVAGWSFSARMTADICVSALEMAKRRGYVAGGAVFHSGLAVHQRGARGVGRRQRREALRGPHGLLPGQRGRGEPVGEPQEGDVPPQDVRDARGGQGGLHRPGRAVLQPLAPALGDRLQAPGGPDGRVPEQDGGDVQGRGLPGGIVSEILTHFNLPALDHVELLRLADQGQVRAGGVEDHEVGVAALFHAVAFHQGVLRRVVGAHLPDGLELVGERGLHAVGGHHRLLHHVGVAVGTPGVADVVAGVTAVDPRRHELLEPRGPAAHRVGRLAPHEVHVARRERGDVRLGLGGILAHAKLTRDSGDGAAANEFGEHVAFPS